MGWIIVAIMILITGAGGKTGRTLVKALSKFESVRAFVRREELVPVIKSLGAADVFVGDMRDESAVHSAMQGVMAVYHICPNMNPDEEAIGKLVVGEARKAGIEHFVYHSVLHPQTKKMKHHWGKMRVEEMIFESGIPFTILQPAPYMQNLLAGWKSIVEEGVLRVPYSVHSKFSFVDLEDVAEAAKIVLTEPDHKNAIYELAGTMPTSHVEVAEIFGRVLKRHIRAEQEEIGDWRLRAGGMREYTLESLINMFEYYDQWGLAGNPNALRWLLKENQHHWKCSLIELCTSTMQKINALSLTPAVNEWLTNSHHLRILHVFDQACNLINARGEVLSIVTPQIGNGPFNLVVEDEVLFSDYPNLQSPVPFFATQLHLGSLTIPIASAELWNPRPDWENLHLNKNNILHQLQTTNYKNCGLDTPLVTIPRGYSTNTANSKLLITNNQFSNSLISAVAFADLPSSLTAAKQLSGLGIGLTPAGDDFIMGALYASWIIHPREIATTLAKEIAEAAAPLTTSLSAAWLKSAGRGEAGILWHEFFDAFIDPVSNLAILQYPNYFP